MSFRALVIPEDPTLNGYILQPLVERILEECGKPHAHVKVLTNPRASGYAHAKALLETQVLARYAFFDLLLFLPDADGNDRRAEFAALEALAQRKQVALLCCAAVEEVEAWVLAGHVQKLGRPWDQVRADRSVKEHVFAGFLAQHGDPHALGQGRDLLMLETLRHYDGLLQRCPELAELQGRIEARLGRK